MHRFLIVLLAAVAAIFATSAAGAAKPNVIVIMADDLGAEGLGVYGSTIYTTPQLDRMAEEGIRLNNAYATPLCTPTRVMIMSGLYPNRSGYMALMGKGERKRLEADLRTFGHDFKDAGYKTAIAGKWQLGTFDEFPGQPVEHGFDEYCMWTWIYEGKKQSRYYAPSIHTKGEIIEGKRTEYGPDFYRRFVLDFIDRNKDEPFFIYFPMALVHSPFEHPPKLEELARGKFTDDLDAKTRAFGHMITYMDDIVGQIMARLREHGIDKNTLVIFTADNGTHKSITSKLPGMELKGGKATLTEAGTRVPFIAWWPGTVQPGVSDRLFCLADVLPTICSVAGIELNREVDGMDLSHYLSGEEGIDRGHVFITWKSGSYVRDQRFRLNIEGKKNKQEVTLYDIPATSDKARYGESVTTNPEHDSHRQRLKKVLDEYLAIQAQEKG